MCFLKGVSHSLGFELGEIALTEKDQPPLGPVEDEYCVNEVEMEEANADDVAPF